MFVHLRLHTEYSLVDSVVRIARRRRAGLMDAVAAAGMPAVALTDQSNLFAMVKFYRAAQAAGVKPIIGVDLLRARAGRARGALAPDAAVPERRRLPQSHAAGQSRAISKASSAALATDRARAGSTPTTCAG